MTVRVRRAKESRLIGNSVRIHSKGLLGGSSPVSPGISFTILTQGEAVPVAGVATTASVTTINNALVLLCVEGRWSAPPGATPFLSASSAHNPWTQAVETIGFTDPSNRWVSAFRHLGTGATGTITITGPATLTGMSWMVIQFTGVTTSGVNGLGAVNNVNPLDTAFGFTTSPIAGQPNVPISGIFASGDLLFAYCQTEDGENVLIPSEAGSIEIADFIGTLETGHAAQYSPLDNRAGGFLNWSNMRDTLRAWATFGAIIKKA